MAGSADDALAHHAWTGTMLLTESIFIIAAGTYSVTSKVEVAGLPRNSATWL